MFMGSYLCQSSSKPVNDSFDCLHRRYGHGAKVKNKQYDVLAEILRKLWEISCEFFAT